VRYQHRGKSIMASGKYLSLEEARKAITLKQFGNGL
jgi:hypothetical protein